jgi:ribonucleoside-triphosphate reductase
MESTTIRGIHEECPNCGSENVEHMTRVTGFFSKVGSWNKGKLAELRDRYRSQGHFTWVEA